VRSSGGGLKDGETMTYGQDIVEKLVAFLDARARTEIAREEEYLQEIVAKESYARGALIRAIDESVRELLPSD
jgi:hypothetical protein